MFFQRKLKQHVINVQPICCKMTEITRWPRTYCPESYLYTNCKRQNPRARARKEPRRSLARIRAEDGDGGQDTGKELAIQNVSKYGADGVLDVGC